MGPKAHVDEEKKALRPYRRLVIGLFVVIALSLVINVVRGITQHLDRLPSVDTHAGPRTGVVDVRALMACRVDLERLESRIRSAAGTYLSASPEQRRKHPSWESVADDMERERVEIVNRCNLEEAGSETLARSLSVAADAIENLLRSYTLLYARFVDTALEQSAEAQQSLRAANR
jgi:hypothetical protein